MMDLHSLAMRSVSTTEVARSYLPVLDSVVDGPPPAAHDLQTWRARVWHCTGSNGKNLMTSFHSTVSSSYVSAWTPVWIHLD